MELKKNNNPRSIIVIKKYISIFLRTPEVLLKKYDIITPEVNKKKVNIKTPEV